MTKRKPEPEPTVLDKAKKVALAQFDQNPDAAIQQFVQTLAGDKTTKHLLTRELVRHFPGIIHTKSKQKFRDLLRTLKL